MPAYMTLVKLTERGLKEIKDSGKRAAELKAHAKKHGIEIKEQYWCLGAYDGFILFDAPDDATATAAMLSVSFRGFITTQTLRCFGAAEMAKILDRIA